jgi:hypothetical protein
LLGDYEACGARGRLSFMPDAGERGSRLRSGSERAQLRQVRHLQFDA